MASTPGSNPTAHGSADRSCFHKTVSLRDWWLIKVPNDGGGGERLAVAGVDCGGQQLPRRVFLSAPIAKRFDSFSLETEDGIWVLINGFLNKQKTTENGFSPEVVSSFRFGFPPEWNECVAKFLGGDPGSIQISIPTSLHFDQEETPLEQSSRFFTKQKTATSSPASEVIESLGGASGATSQSGGSLGISGEYPCYSARRVSRRKRRICRTLPRRKKRVGSGGNISGQGGGIENNVSSAETNQMIEPTKIASQNIEEDSKPIPSTANTDRPSYDWYKWKNYGQKQVKGSEYLRIYFKCMHPNCPVKKKVERSLDGQITEIVYEGEHNHSQPPERCSSSTQGVDTTSDRISQDTNNQLWNSQFNGRNEGYEGRVEDQNEVVVSKRRTSETQSSEAGISGEGVQDPRVVVQSSAESDMIGDGFGWRKYGQKVVKGSPYPKNYYRCTSLKCSVRKYVETVSDDSKTFITTYKGKHNHDMPLKNTIAQHPKRIQRPLQAKKSHE